MLERPAHPARVADPAGQRQRIGEPLLGVAHLAGGVLQQTKLTQGRRHQPVAAGELSLLQRGDERSSGLLVPALLVPEIAEDAVGGGPELRGGDPERGPKGAFGLIQPAQGCQRLGMQHDCPEIVDLVDDAAAEPARTCDQVTGAAMVVAGQRRAGDPYQGVEAGLASRPRGVRGGQRHRCRQVVGAFGMMPDKGRDLRLGAAEELHPPLRGRRVPAGSLHLGQAGVGYIAGHRMDERPQRFPGMRGPQELAFGEGCQRPVDLVAPAVLQRGQRVGGEPAAEHRRGPQDGLRDRVQVVDTGRQHRLHSGRQCGLGQGSLKHPAGGLDARRLAAAGALHGGSRCRELLGADER